MQLHHSTIAKGTDKFPSSAGAVLTRNGSAIGPAHFDRNRPTRAVRCPGPPATAGMRTVGVTTRR